MTKAFNFSLQKVLDVRAMVEDAKAIDLQKAQAETQLEKQKLASTQAEKDAIVQSKTKNNQDQNITLHSLNNRMAYVEQLTDEIVKQGKVVVKSEESTEEQRVAFVQASKEKMVMEKLKEHHKEVFKRKVNQEQVKSESEVAARIARKEGVV